MLKLRSGLAALLMFGVIATAFRPTDIDGFDDPNEPLTITLDEGDFAWTARNSRCSYLKVYVPNGIRIANARISIANITCGGPADTPCIQFVTNTNVTLSNVSIAVTDIVPGGRLVSGEFTGTTFEKVSFATSSIYGMRAPYSLEYAVLYLGFKGAETALIGDENTFTFTDLSGTLHRSDQTSPLLRVVSTVPLDNLRLNMSNITSMYTSASYPFALHTDVKLPAAKNAHINIADFTDVIFNVQGNGWNDRANFTDGSSLRIEGFKTTTKIATNYYEGCAARVRARFVNSTAVVTNADFTAGGGAICVESPADRAVFADKSHLEISNIAALRGAETSRVAFAANITGGSSVIIRNVSADTIDIDAAGIAGRSSLTVEGSDAARLTAKKFDFSASADPSQFSLRGSNFTELNLGTIDPTGGRLEFAGVRSDRGLRLAVLSGTNVADAGILIADLTCVAESSNDATPCVHLTVGANATLKNVDIAIANVVHDGDRRIYADFDGATLEKVSFTATSIHGMRAPYSGDFGVIYVGFKGAETALIGDESTFTFTDLSGSLLRSDQTSPLMRFVSAVPLNNLCLNIANVTNTRPDSTFALHVDVMLRNTERARLNVANFNDTIFNLQGQGSINAFTYFADSFINIEGFTTTVKIATNYFEGCVARIRAHLISACNVSVTNADLEAGGGAVCIGTASPHSIVADGSHIVVAGINARRGAQISGISLGVDIIGNSSAVVRNVTADTIAIDGARLVDRATLTIEDSDTTHLTIDKVNLAGANPKPAEIAATATRLSIRRNTVAEVKITSVNTTGGLLEFVGNGRSDERVVKGHEASLTIAGLSGIGAVSDLNNAWNPSVNLVEGTFTGSYELWGNTRGAVGDAEVDVSTLQPATFFIESPAPRSLLIGATAPTTRVVVRSDRSATGENRTALIASLRFACAKVATLDTSAAAAEEQAVNPSLACGSSAALTRCEDGYWFYPQSGRGRRERDNARNVTSCGDLQSDSSADDKEGEKSNTVVLAIAVAAAIVVAIGGAALVYHKVYLPRAAAKAKELAEYENTKLINI